MKELKKQTVDGLDQFFVIMTSRKEIKEFTQDIMSESDYDKNGLWGDEDSSLSWVTTDGEEYSVSLGDKLAKINWRKVAQMIYVSEWGCQVYGPVIIEKNGRYGDWDVAFDYNKSILK